MLRLFTAIALPENLSARLALLQGGVSGAAWVAPEKYHITLTFLGETDEDAAERADEALASVRVPAFSLRLQGCGVFSKGARAESLWLGVEKNDALHRLHDKIARALEEARVDFEKRKYTPHLTLARLKHPDEAKLADFLKGHAAFSGEAFTVDSFSIYHSRQTKGGSVYEELQAYPLV
jgi:2'-5' RNA ligase